MLFEYWATVCGADPTLTQHWFYLLYNSFPYNKLEKLTLYVYVYINPLSATLSFLNFLPLDVVSRYRDPQFQVAENHSYLFNLRHIGYV